MPQWYHVYQAAKYLGVPPWELEARPSYYTERAIIMMSAESEAQKIRRNGYDGDGDGSDDESETGMRPRRSSRVVRRIARPRRR